MGHNGRAPALRSGGAASRGRREDTMVGVGSMLAPERDEEAAAVDTGPSRPAAGARG